MLAAIGNTGAQADEARELITSPPEDTASPELRALCTEEAMRLGADETATIAGDACAVACATGYAALCARVTAICQAAAVITIGSAVVPCAAAMSATCIGGAGLAAICGRRCPP